MAANHRGSYLATAAVFLIGLPLSVTLVGTALWAAGIGRGGGSFAPTTLAGAFAWYAVIIVFVAWPAILLTSVIMPLLSKRLPSLYAWLGAGAAVCGAVTLVSGVVMGAKGDLTEMLALSWVFLLYGGAAGAACAFVSDRFRPRPLAP